MIRFVTKDQSDDLSPYVVKVLDVIGDTTSVVTEESTLRDFLDPTGFDQRIHTARSGMNHGWKMVPGDPIARHSNEDRLRRWGQILGFPLAPEDTFVLVARRLRSTAK